MKTRSMGWVLACALGVGCSAGNAVVAERESALAAHLYDGVSAYGRPIQTSSREAQQYFDQGLQFLYGFNHEEAIRSFRAAGLRDPSAPMPWWGVAYAYGMNINDSKMTEARWQAAFEALGEAQQRLAGANAKEAALVRALSQRYSWPPPAEQRTLDQAYAAAMEEVYAAYPGDADVAVLYAESLMDLQPWDYWTSEGEPKGRISEVVEVLESVLAEQPDHPGATHFYIHAVEASKTPERATDAADRLLLRVPGAGHLVHMPSHIYIRTGRYTDAAEANTLAVAADRRYLEKAPEPTTYWIYVAHNLHFLAYASMMEGRYEAALRAARDLEHALPEEIVKSFSFLIEGILPTTFHVLIRFGRWQEILAHPEPAEHRLISRAVRHYARGVAFSALGRTEEARAEVLAFDAAAAAVPETWNIFNNKVTQVLPIARAMLEGELRFREGDHEAAFAALREGVAIEDQLVYDEPPGWMLPVRHPLGAFLMSAGHYAEAEKVYREDLERNRNNGWSLLGLKLALEKQGRPAEAAEVELQLARAWPRADVRPTSSCMCEPSRR